MGLASLLCVRFVWGRRVGRNLMGMDLIESKMIGGGRLSKEKERFGKVGDGGGVVGGAVCGMCVCCGTAAHLSFIKEQQRILFKSCHCWE